MVFSWLRLSPISGKLLGLVWLFLMVGNVAVLAQSTTWQEAKANKKGNLIVHWYESKPFIYRNGQDQVDGVEFELLQGFKQYLREKYEIDLSLEWRESKSFSDTYELVKGATGDCIGASAFSITPDREADVNFAPPYMSDISVLISNHHLPVAQSLQEFKDAFSSLTAITVKGTTYEHDLLRLKNETGMDFKIEYIPSHQNILRTIEGRDSTFGFIDLPVYMMIFSADPSVRVKRQNHYSIKRQGYSLIFPLNSDWREPLEEYFTEIKPHFEKIVGKYVDLDLYHFVEDLAWHSNDELELLTKEKEIQYKDIISKSSQLEATTRNNNYLIGLISVTLVSLVIITILYRKRNEQKNKIELQQQSIELKNKQLEKRNEHLVTLDEEKNNLIKILAHDLRTPINHVQGLAQVLMLSNPGLPGDQKEIIQNITDAALRLNRMISNILDVDAIENNRVKLFCERTEISSLTRKVVTSFEKAATRKQIEIVSVGMDQAAFGFVDSLFFTQVLENLISNALKFSEKGKKVTVSLVPAASTIAILVKDQGPGLSAEDQNLLFRKFQRLSPRPTDGEVSTGLGLSIVKKYVELMEGRVWCESEVGKGCTFTVELKKV